MDPFKLIPLEFFHYLTTFMAKPVRNQNTFFSDPVISTVLTRLSGVALFLVLITLPLVGKAGSDVPYAGKSYVAFLVILLVSLALSVLALTAKWRQYKEKKIRRPHWALMQCGGLLLLLVALLTGALKI